MLYIYLFFKIPEKKSMNFDYPWFHPAWLGEICDKKKHRNQMSNLPIICTNT